jgi:hypothetical protein
MSGPVVRPIEFLTHSIMWYQGHTAGENYLVVDIDWDNNHRQLWLEAYKWECASDGVVGQVQFDQLVRLGPEVIE